MSTVESLYRVPLCTLCSPAKRLCAQVEQVLDALVGGVLVAPLNQEVGQVDYGLCADECTVLR